MMKSAWKAIPVILAVFVMQASLGCSSVCEDICEKYDECNIMPVGLSVDSCSEKCEKAWDNLTSGEQDDCEDAAENCLEKEDCINFAYCQVPTVCYF